MFSIIKVLAMRALAWLRLIYSLDADGERLYFFRGNDARREYNSRWYETEVLVLRESVWDGVWRLQRAWNYTRREKFTPALVTLPGRLFVAAVWLVTTREANEESHEHVTLYTRKVGALTFQREESVMEEDEAYSISLFGRKLRCAMVDWAEATKDTEDTGAGIYEGDCIYFLGFRTTK